MAREDRRTLSIAVSRCHTVEYARSVVTFMPTDTYTAHCRCVLNVIRVMFVAISHV